MSIQAICPSCGHVHKLSERQRGKTVACEHCEADFVVEGGKESKPKVEVTVIARPPVTKSKKASVSTRDRDYDDERDIRANNNMLYWLVGGGLALFFLIVGSIVLVLVLNRDSTPNQPNQPVAEGKKKERDNGPGGKPDEKGKAKDPVKKIDPPKDNDQQKEEDWPKEIEQPIEKEKEKERPPKKDPDIFPPKKKDHRRRKPSNGRSCPILASI
jgi:hypothetical protein